ncbi:RluA family pseudouridine synthase [Thermosipho ferrireducens]|uniref:Pseudouridine synthase n=1 Tax=Thermosipho ferrireducens TaxID=2571116 RepID=A0ABX7S9T3_9BACT|nr:RluA family pseudouridine synthase [Thermosipho ferrireducens]QTA38676.1 RluA family pseudouridine synthase [Thermosipho ferrireducens]
MKVTEKNYYSRLDKFLRKTHENIPLNAIYKLIRKGFVKVNGKRVKTPSFKLEIGDEVEIFTDISKYNRKTNYKLRPIPMELDVIYEDSNLLIINKKPGIPIHPGKGVHIATIIEGLMYYGNQNNFEPYLVHRLDKHTSGVLIVAKNPEAARKMGKLISNREVEKEYITLVAGKISRSGEIKLSLDNLEAVTYYKPLNLYETELGVFTKLCVKIKTGRKHQIRRHFSLINHPVVGDDLYGKRKLNHEFRRLYGLKRYFLHCKRMAFYFNNKFININTEIPEDLKIVLKKLENK